MLEQQASYGLKSFPFPLLSGSFCIQAHWSYSQAKSRLPALMVQDSALRKRVAIHIMIFHFSKDHAVASLDLYLLASFQFLKLMWIQQTLLQRFFFINLYISLTCHKYKHRVPFRKKTIVCTLIFFIANFFCLKKM